MDDRHETPRILIVDDTPDNIDVLGDLLSEYRRSVALDGEQALAHLAAKAPPDLILLDVMMPGMDGFEVCRRIRADPRLRDVPVIFITALGDEKAESRGFEVGAVDYITKPFRPEAVKARVQTHLALQCARRALAEQNSVLERKVDERTGQLSEALARLQQASIDTIIRLSRAAEYKDEDTGAHVIRMSHYAAAVARKMGLDAGAVEELLHAAPMHDIGKIAIPDRILLKPGKLDPEEWNVMKRHATIGAEILSRSDADVIRTGEVIAASHHEKWDGSGYPNGLKGEDIPIAGRIVAIADVFDALTTKRPYKEPFPIEKAFGILREGRGAHFDPAVVDAFFAVESVILEIKARYQEDTGSRFFHMAGATPR
ncbi:MAG: two-component system response regulator [Myxococcota bacterium]|nr:two-component system response regulator [Myxococcota bacterium]